MQDLTTKHLTREDSEQIAVLFLGFLAREPEHFSRFMALTGMSLEEVRHNADGREFQLALLDYLLGDEALLLTFCANENIPPEIIAPARHKLSGDLPPVDET